MKGCLQCYQSYLSHALDTARETGEDDTPADEEAERQLQAHPAQVVDAVRHSQHEVAVRFRIFNYDIVFKIN